VGNRKSRNTKGEKEVLAQKASKIYSDTQTCKYFGLYWQFKYLFYKYREEAHVVRGVSKQAMRDME